MSLPSLFCHNGHKLVELAALLSTSVIGLAQGPAWLTDCTWDEAQLLHLFTHFSPQSNGVLRHSLAPRPTTTVLLLLSSAAALWLARVSALFPFHWCAIQLQMRENPFYDFPNGLFLLLHFMHQVVSFAFLRPSTSAERSSTSVSEARDLATTCRVTASRGRLFFLSLFLHFGIPPFFQHSLQVLLFLQQFHFLSRYFGVHVPHFFDNLFPKILQSFAHQLFFRSIMAKSFLCLSLTFLTTPEPLQAQMAARLAQRMEENVGFSSLQSVHHTFFWCEQVACLCR